MNPLRFVRSVAALALLGGGAASLPPFAFAQSDQAGPPPTPDGGPVPGRRALPTLPADSDPVLRHMQAAQNAERQKALVQETQRLLKLANELNDVVGKSTKDTLSLDVIKKAEEVEKLAKQVKEKMRGSP